MIEAIDMTNPQPLPEGHVIITTQPNGYVSGGTGRRTIPAADRWRQGYTYEVYEERTNDYGDPMDAIEYVSDWDPEVSASSPEDFAHDYSTWQAEINPEVDKPMPETYNPSKTMDQYTEGAIGAEAPGVVKQTLNTGFSAFKGGLKLGAALTAQDQVEGLIIHALGADSPIGLLLADAKGKAMFRLLFPMALIGLSKQFDQYEVASKVEDTATMMLTVNTAMGTNELFNSLISKSADLMTPLMGILKAMGASESELRQVAEDIPDGIFDHSTTHTQVPIAQTL